ncbi:hypothetical protein E4K10_18090 [Streptomyces sp. T1317-0309]|nr:hypothetical protein E4K10_18090 [Streptomyces sp. T1317-0309]
MVKAHRFAYELANGPIPKPVEGEKPLVLDHLCRRRNCVNVAHLELVDSRTNTLRGNSPSARNAAKTRCDSGHDLTTPANVYIKTRGTRPNGSPRSPERVCRTCQRQYKRAYDARRRATQKAS